MNNLAIKDFIFELKYKYISAHMWFTERKFWMRDNLRKRRTDKGENVWDGSLMFDLLSVTIVLLTCQFVHGKSCWIN